MQRALAALLTLAAAACVSRDAVDEEALMDPVRCAGCHPDQYRQWSGSMHAYASDDPVFVALEGFGQQDTDGTLGTLCMGCHAPMAVWAGAADHGAELADLPRAYRGVTCYTCHQIDRADGEANGALHYAGDQPMRGSLGDPVDTPAHPQMYEPLLDSTRTGSSAGCGPCHDVALPGVDIERTYAEWQDSLFAGGAAALSCSACHMPGADAPAAAVAGAPVRRVHDHSMPGVDVALTPWPEMEAQRAAVARDLDDAISTRLCVVPGDAGLDVSVTLDNLLVGHKWPSGVTHARRAWVELAAWQDGRDQPVYASGLPAEGEAVIGSDPDLWLLATHFLDADGAPVPVPWRAAEVTGELLPYAVTADRSDPRFYHAVTRTYRIASGADRITLHLRIQPVGYDILDLLISLDRLDPAVRDRMPTFEVTQGAREWRLSNGYGCVP
ncbi:MAG TPA: cytochrome c family protein [Kofleriaceae bacterium]|nr:cytochrome c family protein [Kofleriaceae bacterium]